MTDKVSGEISPELKTILDRLSNGGHHEAAAASGLDFIFYNWASLISDDENLGNDPDETVISLMGIYDACIGVMKDIKPTMKKAAKEAAAEGADAETVRFPFKQLVEGLEGKQIEHVAVADVIKEMFTRSGSATTVVDEYAGVVKILEGTRDEARSALEKAVKDIGVNPPTYN